MLYSAVLWIDSWICDVQLSVLSCTQHMHTGWGIEPTSCPQSMVSREKKLFLFDGRRSLGGSMCYSQTIDNLAKNLPSRQTWIHIAEICRWTIYKFSLYLVILSDKRTLLDPPFVWKKQNSHFSSFFKVGNNTSRSIRNNKRRTTRTKITTAITITITIYNNNT